jgi:hypothetical protein
MWFSSVSTMSRLVTTTLLKPVAGAMTLSNQQRYMSKYLSKSATKRLALTTKRVRKGYVKGHGATKEGRVTSKGRFIVDHLARLKLNIPDLTGFKVRELVGPFVVG